MYSLKGILFFSHSSVRALVLSLFRTHVCMAIEPAVPTTCSSLKGVTPLVHSSPLRRTPLFFRESGSRGVPTCVLVPVRASPVPSARARGVGSKILSVSLCWCLSVSAGSVQLHAGNRGRYFVVLVFGERSKSRPHCLQGGCSRASQECSRVF